MKKARFVVPRLGDVEIEDTLLYYDGPVLFTVRSSNGGRYIGFWSDDLDDASVFWYSALSDERYQKLLSGEIEVRSPFVEVDYVLEARRSHSTAEYISAIWKSPAELDSEALPEEGYKFSAAESDKTISAGFAETAHVLAKREGRAVARFILNVGQKLHEAPAAATAGLIMSCQRLINAIGFNIADTNQAAWKEIRELNLLAFRPARVGSLGIELMAVRPSEMMDLSLVEKSLDVMLDLFDAGSDQEKLKQCFAPLDVRAARAFRDLLSSLEKSGGDVLVEAGTTAPNGERQTPVTKHQITKMVTAMKQVEKRKSELEFEAELVGLDKESPTWFHVRRISDDASFQGKATGQAADALQDVSTSKRYLVKILETISYGSVSDEPASAYELIEMFELIPPDDLAAGG